MGNCSERLFILFPGSPLGNCFLANPHLSACFERVKEERFGGTQNPRACLPASLSVCAGTLAMVFVNEPLPD